MAKAYALTTTDRLTDYLGITATGTTATVLERIIDSVTEFIENYVQRRFKKTTFTNELYTGDRSEVLLLKNYPVISSESFTLQRRNSSANEDDWETIDAEDYFVDYATGIVRYTPGFHFARGANNYRVTYTAGFDFNNTSTFLGDTEAGDIEYVTWRLCSVAFNRRKGEPGVQSESIGDYRVSYMKEAFENDEVKAILDKYARFDTIGYQTPKSI